MFHVFTRRWWKDNPSWPNGLEPYLGRKSRLGYVDTEEEARAMCAEYNSTHEPGKYSIKAEYARC